MSQKKPSGLWWKMLLGGILTTGLSPVLGFMVAVMDKPKAVVYVGFSTGQEKIFEMSEGATMWLHETNRGLGSSPASISDPEKTVRIFGPDGEPLSFSEDRQGEDGAVMGTYEAPSAGTYRLIADSAGKHAESRGELRGRRPYSFLRTLCDVCFFVLLPLGLLSSVAGVVLGIIRGLGKALEGGLEEGSV